MVRGRSFTDFFPIPNPYMTKNAKLYKDLLKKYEITNKGTGSL